MGMVRAFNLLLLLFAGAWTLQAAALPEGCIPPPTDRTFVYDFVGQLSAQEVSALNADLRTFTDTTSHVIVVVIHPDFCGLEPSTFATELGHEWGVGRADEDNGVVVAIRPRSGNRSGAIFIAPGYGLEGAIPDLVASRVVQEMTPYLARGNYRRALEIGTGDLMRLASGEWTQGDYLSGDGAEQRAGVVAFLLFLLVFIGVPGWAIWSSVKGIQRKQGIDWTAAWVLFWAASQRSSGRYRHFHHSSGPFGGPGGSGFGGGSGGFGGFGGGGFGGGGAGGSF